MTDRREPPLADRLAGPSLDPGGSEAAAIRLTSPRWPLLIAGPLAVVIAVGIWIILGASLAAADWLRTFGSLAIYPILGIVLPPRLAPERRRRAAIAVAVLALTVVIAEQVATAIAATESRQSGAAIYTVYWQLRTHRIALLLTLAIWFGASCVATTRAGR